MPNVICNTSPLQYLHQVNLLYLLPELYHHVLVPQAVADEINTGKQNQENLPVLRDLPWVTIKRPSEILTKPHSSTSLGTGEKHVISLGVDTQDALLVIDDRTARQHAFDLGLNVIGTVGVLVQAKQTGLLVSIKPALDRLLNMGFRLSNDIYRKGLELAGENIEFNYQR